MDSDQVQQWLDELPIRTTHALTGEQFYVRLSAVLRLLDIDAVGDRTGIYFPGDGVPEEDQALLFAVREMLSRRFLVEP
jgi:hypothetical protein